MNPEQPGGPAPPQQTPPGSPASQAYPAPPSGQPVDPLNQYQFIMSPPTSKRGLPLSGLSSRLRIGMIAGAALVVIIILVIVASAIGNSGKGPIKSVIPVAEDQTELTRVATLAQNQAVDQSVQNVAVSVQLSQASATQQTLNYLGTNHIKVSGKELALKQSAQTTTALSTAAANNTFDQVFIDAIKADLTTYMHDLQSAYKANPGPKGRAMLSGQFDGAQLLLTQVNQATPSAN